MTNKTREEIDNETCEATHEELCDGMLRHYKEVSKEACSSRSGIEEAILFYKDWGNGKIEKALQEERERTKTVLSTKHTALLSD
jgi:hypothetical protein